MKKLAILPLAVLLLSVFAPMVYAETTTFYSTASDGDIDFAALTFNDAWTAATGNDPYDEDVECIMVLNEHQAGTYQLARSAFFFDTSSIPEGMTILSATLSFYSFSLYTDSGHYDIVVQNGQPTYPHDPLVVGDYDKSHYSGDGGSINTADWNADGWNNITLNADGRSWINTEGTTKFLIRSSTDIAGTEAPADDYNSAEVYTNEKGEGFIPKLTVSYTSVDVGNLYKFLRYDGDDYVNILGTIDMNFTGGDFTVECWHRRTALWEQGINPAPVAKMTVEENHGWELYFTIRGPAEDDEVWAAFFGYDDEWDTFDAEGYINLNDYEWHHIVGRRSGADFELWVDGDWDYTDVCPDVGDVDSSANFHVGASISADEWTKGDIDEVRLYNRNITDAEIAYSFAIKKPLNQTGLVLWLRFNEGTGDTTYDETANDNDGTLMPDYPSNAPVWVDETPTTAGEAVADKMDDAALVAATVMTIFVVIWAISVVSGEGQVRDIWAYLLLIAVILLISNVVKGIG